MKKKVLGICGVQKKFDFSSSQFLLEQALKAAEEEGAETELIRLIDYNIKECIACGNCLANQPCPLHVDSEDDLKLLYQKCLEADAFIFSSPVYALSLPSIWKKWIDRCDVNSDEDLDYEYYNYDTVEKVKGKAFRGKVAGQIAVAAGIGHEMALASLMPAFTAVKLTIVANVGLSLIEYDSEPGIKGKEWSKNIQDANFAIDMVRALGKRVYETIGFSAFDVKSKPQNQIVNTTMKFNDILKFPLKNVKDNDVCFDDEKKDLLVIIASSQNTASIGAQWSSELLKKYNDSQNIKILSLACINQLPHFITKDFVISSIQKSVGNNDIYFDWNMNFVKKCSIQTENTPHILLIDKVNQKILFTKSIDFNQSNFNELDLVIANRLYYKKGC
ncbi:flavodoxin family protein [Clostridium botulinum]|uniref:Flavodoxin family protein n=1 Tax=Clostridium botulinum TaxID=1491 RepID=A0A6M0SQ95_CLOBO|nr:flavodoxin family protein [Clostridium botulinum]